MLNKTKNAIKNARKWMTGADPQTAEGAIQYAQAWALIAIAEVLLEQTQQAEFQAEVEEMRRERELTPPF